MNLGSAVQFKLFRCFCGGSHSALGSFVHFHVVAPDGVFTRGEDGVVRFHAGRAPTREEIADVAGRVRSG